MSFLHPEFFYYMLPPLFVLFGFLLTQKATISDFFSEEVMKKLRVGENTLPLKMRNFLFFMVSVLLVIGLAEPVIKKGKVEVKSKSADIIIALDISDSMLAEDVYPNRLKFAKEKAMNLLGTAPNERIGIVAFAKNSYLVSPMSFDHDAVSFLLKQLSTDSITEKGTNFLSLLKVVENTIETTSQKHLLILSDGGDADDFSEEIAYAKEKNIVVFVLGIGTKKGAPIKKSDGSFITYKGEVIVSSLNSSIAEFATATGGVYIKALKSTDDVEAMLLEIENRSEKKELKSEIIEKFIPLFYYPIGLALFLLLLAMSSLPQRVPVLFILAFLSLSVGEVKAGMLDFMDLREAKEAYTASKYEKAQKLYGAYAKDSNSSQSYYNQANAFYKQKKYDEALKAYKKTSFEDSTKKANSLANIGNSYVKQGKEKALENALKSYEESLKLFDDKDVRENLEAVKKELKKQKEKEKKKQDKKKDKNKKDEKNKDSDDKKKSEDSKDDSKDKKEKNSKKDKNKQNKEKKDQDKKDQKDKDKPEEKKKKDLEKMDEDKKDSKNEAGKTPRPKKEEMSDAEQQKWLNKLNAEQNTYMYMLNNTQKNEENSDEKPW